MNNNFIEMFSGIGGMGYGLMQAGWNCVGYAEIDKYAHQAYEILHDPEKRMWNAYDVKSVTDDDLRLLGRERGPIQLLAGGFPCQSFSIAGKRQGFTDATRGTLFFEIIRWASILRPKYLLLENVTGLLNHDEGRTFKTVIGSLDELGYVGEWCVLNSAAYVPQNRERIFIVASLRGSSRPKIFPFGSENSNTIEVIGKLEGNHDQNSRVYGVDGLSLTLGTMQGGGQVPKIYCINPKKEDGSQTYQQDRIYQTDGIMPALSAQLDGRFGIIVDDEIRYLTPLECFRLQSYPDEWYFKLKENGISPTQLYKMAGNGVTSEVARQIGLRLAAGHQSTEPPSNEVTAAEGKEWLKCQK